MSRIEVEDPDSGRTLRASWLWLGQDLVVAIGGGDRPHVGSIVVAQPQPSHSRPGTHSASCSVVTIPPHKEEAIARPVATRLTETLGVVTVVSAGVHEDSLDPDAIAAYLRLAEELAQRLGAQLGVNPVGGE
jgi:hypothetical protein